MVYGLKEGDLIELIHKRTNNKHKGIFLKLEPKIRKKSQAVYVITRPVNEDLDCDTVSYKKKLYIIKKVV